LGTGASIAKRRCYRAIECFATNRGGALVRIEGLRGFIPGSHISTREAKEDLVGQELPLKFLEVDEDRNRLVLSHRRALVEGKMNGLAVGQVVIGSVRNQALRCFHRYRWSQWFTAYFRNLSRITLTPPHGFQCQ
jgi:hypothetical protein